ncbi:hypothetical protein [Rhodanobacter sp. C05]|jgi:hypothetical protein|uniref:hypothetical protein n=1 Tax=Rhodanobacter sp. C05 TaxID=1945855 RepID=UPI00117AE31C|nr:hypothetical protein [Rhodanobacter sp. C05]
MQNAFTAVTPDYRPWGDAIPAALGTKGTALTDAGHPVEVWQPNAGIPAKYRYWCHGHATFSYWLHGFSIFSNADMETVLSDEWVRVDKKPIVGDIIVFRADADGVGYASGAILHTARVESAAHHFGGRTNINVSSKNGTAKLKLASTPAEVLGVYNDCHWFKTEQACCCSTKRIDKQYYRRLDRTVAQGTFVAWATRNMDRLR